jgi:hypothetical protein
VSAVINAPADKVWSTIRDFGELAGWHPGFTESAVEGGGRGEAVGVARRIVLTNGAVIRERLLGLDDRERSCVYGFIESPLEVENYVGTIKVTPVTDGDASFVEWWSTFDCAPERRQEFVDLFKSVYQGGIDNLKKTIR